MTGTSETQKLTVKMRHAVKLAVKRSPLGVPLQTLLSKQLPLAPALKMGGEQGWDQAAHWLLSPDGWELLQDQRLLNLLTRSINTSIGMELLLTQVRKALLCNCSQLLREPPIQRFACALIQQCMNNEYVFFVSDDEKHRLATLDAGTTDPALRPFLLALYHPPHEVFDRDLSHLLASDSHPEFVTLVRRHMETYAEEMDIAGKIEQLSVIEDEASRKVAAMYEVYPYPRWLDLIQPVPGSRGNVLRSYFDENELQFLQGPFEVLVAGCGTGRKAIQVALGYGERASILGTDLSRRSLAYATRMAARYRAGNIRFLRLDILNLPALDRQFDIVECTGVIHHMDDPLQGWRALVDVTKPGGVMHISLYSELARREIVKIRKQVEKETAAPDADYIRAYRHRLMLTNPNLIDALPTRSDFFDLSRCKDLLFHVLEHRFTIPQIARYLDELGLEFHGFETPKPLDNKLWTTFPHGPHRRNLDHWWHFEQKHPDTFGNLYEIWCRKPARGSSKTQEAA